MANMYNKTCRDPRFDMTLFYNGSKWQGETLGFYEGGMSGRKREIKISIWVIALKSI